MAQIKTGRWVTAAGQSVSTPLELKTETLVGLYTPAALDAAKLKLQASRDGAAFFDVFDGGAALSVDASADAYIPLDPTKTLGAAHVRLVHTDSGGGAVNEASQRVLTPVFRAFE